MKKQSEHLEHSLTPAMIAALLEDTQMETVPIFKIPAGIGRAEEIDDFTTPLKAKKSYLQLVHTLKKANSRTGTATNSLNIDTQGKAELTFGAPQIDLALPNNSFTSGMLHELTPRHHRDQLTTLQTAFRLAARAKSKAGNKPLFCFLTEDQKPLLDWLQNHAAEDCGLSQKDIIIMSANYSDDLIWAIEETLHNTQPAAIIAHFNTLNSLSAQRFAYLTKSNAVTGFLVCNHPSQDNIPAETRWTVESMENRTNLTLTRTKSDTDTFVSWSLKWNQEQIRFSATRNQNSDGSSARMSQQSYSATIH